METSAGKKNKKMMVKTRLDFEIDLCEFFKHLDKSPKKILDCLAQSIEEDDDGTGSAKVVAAMIRDTAERIQELFD